MNKAKKYRKKPVVIEAVQWFENGDHPEVPGDTICSKCGYRMHDHGWIDTLEDGHNCKPDIFKLTYEEVE